MSVFGGEIFYIFEKACFRNVLEETNVVVCLDAHFAAENIVMFFIKINMVLCCYKLPLYSTPKITNHFFNLNSLVRN